MRKHQIVFGDDYAIGSRGSRYRGTAKARVLAVESSQQSPTLRKQSLYRVQLMNDTPRGKAGEIHIVRGHEILRPWALEKGLREDRRRTLRRKKLFAMLADLERLDGIRPPLANGILTRAAYRISPDHVWE